MRLALSEMKLDWWPLAEITAQPIEEAVCSLVTVAIAAHRTCDICLRDIDRSADPYGGFAPL
jgi:hypothetical protein